MERPLVVVIEDDLATAWGLSLVLQDWGYRTVVGDSVEPVVAELRATGESPDAAICDFHLAGGETGIEAASVLLHRYGETLPVVIITATGGSAARRLADRHHFPLLTKPIDPDVLQHYLPAA